MSQPARLRHLRHATDTWRRRHGKSLSLLLSKLVTTLTGTGAASTFTVTAGARSAQTLTFSGNPSNGDTVTIDGITYTFETAIDETAAYSVLIGGTAGDSRDNLVDAINLTEGGSYSNITTKHPTVTAAANAGNMVATAIEYGSAQDAIVTTEASSVLAWGAATLAGGAVSTVTSTAHGLATGAGPINVSSDTTLPAGLAADTEYWAIVVDANTFYLALTLEDAQAGKFPEELITDTGTGTHSWALAAETVGNMYHHLNKPGVNSDHMGALTDIDDINQ